MRRISSLLIAAALVAAALPTFATPAIMAKAKGDKVDCSKACATCHIGTPKDKKLNEVGQKYAPKK